MLNLKSCERIHEPGFSRSECLELASMIERGDISIQTSHQYHGNSINRVMFVTQSKRDLVVAALQAFAQS